MNAQRKRFMLIASTLAVLIVAVASKSAVPLYDGVNFPDEPYRYANPSRRPATQPPGSPTLSFTPHDAQSGLSLVSSELGPQLAIYIDASAVHLSPSVQHATISAKALAPTTEPGDGAIDGNVYRISGTAASGTFTISAAAHDTFNSIQLRLPQGAPPNPVMEFRPLASTTWQQISTEQVGNDIYQSVVDSFGDYALVTLHSAPGSQHLSSSAAKRSLPYVAVFLGVLVVLMAATVALIRLSQRGNASLP
jgi:hypothetical protein